jgi:RimJ/RimL family protein N-acetyltransferase
MIIKKATLEDIHEISRLYFDVYGGTYPDTNLTDIQHISDFLNTKDVHWFVALSENKVIASVIYKFDKQNSLAKAFGAVVDKKYRGHAITQKLMTFGIDYLKQNTIGIEIVYVTTRTVNASAQTLTENLGYKKLGIFPNVRRTSGHETHCLAALFSAKAFENRFTDYKLHPEVKPIYDLVREELKLKDLKIATLKESTVKKETEDLPLLEFIKANEFVNYRFEKLKEQNKLQMEFFPFHKPNILITSPDQTIELFINQEEDGYCAILGAHVDRKVNDEELLKEVSQMLKNHGARYVEIIVRSDRLDVIGSVLKAKFIPCAFVPAFQEAKDETRYDFTVFSRCYEIFDFQNMELKGVNQKFLQLYFEHWERIALNPKIIKRDGHK